MIQSLAATSGLAAFLQQPNIDGSPAWECIDGHARQKSMPTLFHSRLQRNLMNAISCQAQDYEAIQELRCLVPPFSPTPDIAIDNIERLPTEDGPLPGAPDWIIEIRSLDQNMLTLQTKLLYCLNHYDLAKFSNSQCKDRGLGESRPSPNLCRNRYAPNAGWNFSLHRE